MAYTNGASAGPIHAGERFTEAETKRIMEALSRDGYCFLGTSILEQDEVAALRDAMERMIADPAMQEDQPGNHRKARSLMRMFEYDRSFRDLIVREPFASLAEEVLDDQCHVMGQNALFTEPNPDATADGPGGWHLDDLVQFPLPPDIPRHDPGVPLPCNVMQLFTPLTSIDTVACGPTQVVPQSHYAGRRPTIQDRPHFDGNGPVSILAEPGDAYIFNNQGLAPRRAQRLGSQPAARRRHLQQALRRAALLPVHRLPHARARMGGRPARGCSGCSAATSTAPTAERSRQRLMRP